MFSSRHTNTQKGLTYSGSAFIWNEPQNVSHQGLYMPWKVTGMVQSTSARAISDRSLALRMRRYPGLCEPGATTMVSSTPGHTVGITSLEHTSIEGDVYMGLLFIWLFGHTILKVELLCTPFYHHTWLFWYERWTFFLSSLREESHLPGTKLRWVHKCWI